MRNILFPIFKKLAKTFSGHGLSRKWPFGIIFKFLFSKLKPDYVEFEGHKISFPRSDIGDITHDISLFDRWGEKNEVDIFKKEIKNGDIAVSYTHLTLPTTPYV